MHNIEAKLQQLCGIQSEVSVNLLDDTLSLAEKMVKRDALILEIAASYNNLVEHHRYHHVALKELMA